MRASRIDLDRSGIDISQCLLHHRLISGQDLAAASLVHFSVKDIALRDANIPKEPDQGLETLLG